MLGGTSLHFWLAFTSWLVTLYIFYVLTCHFHILFWNVYSSPLAIYWCLTFCGWVLEIFHMLWILFSLSGIWFTNIFFHSMDCYFTLLIDSMNKKFPKFSWSQSCSFFLILSVPFVSYPRNNCQIHVVNFFSYVYF